MPNGRTRSALSSGEIAVSQSARPHRTVVDMPAQLGLPKNDDGKPPMAAGGGRGRRSARRILCLLIDQIGEVLKKLATTAAGKSRKPRSPKTKLAGGVHRLDGQLLVVLDVDRVLDIVPDMLAA